MKTRCPHCQTLFKITNEQLKIHSGQVRCGNCKKLFNAFDALSQVDIDSLNDETIVEVNKKVNTKFIPKIDDVIENNSKKENPKNKNTNANKTNKISKKNKAKDADAEELENIQKSLAEIDSLLYADANEQKQKTKRATADNVALNTNINAVKEKIEPTITYDNETNTDEKITQNSPVDLIENVSEISEEHTKKFWLEKTLPDWFNFAIIALLSLFLILQIFVFFRNNIAQTFPALRSVYNALNLSLTNNAKNIEQITIEASDLNNISNANNSSNKTILKLKIMLGNRANFNQNWPLIELNLTDTLDQSVAKYTFAPQDYLDHLIYQNVAKELDNNHNNNNNNDLKEKYEQEELLYKQFKQKLKYFQAHSEQTIELYIETDNITNAAGYKLAVGYL